MLLHVHAIPQVDATHRGIHVVFAGPPGWMFAPHGFDLERRIARRPHGSVRCVDLDGAMLADLHRDRELATPIGIATLRDGTWRSPTGSSGTAEVLAFDLTVPTTMATVRLATPNFTAYGLRRGKVVATAPAQTAAGQVNLTASAIDRVVVHAQHASAWHVCVVDDQNLGEGWDRIARLQLPLREVDPTLADADAEWERVKSRLIAGDTLTRDRFVAIADTLRGYRSTGELRPLDRSLRIPDPDGTSTWMSLHDPLALAGLDPAVRRALGLAYFDNDPALVAGETYQYRASATYPSGSFAPRAGFHMIPVGVRVPADVFFGDFRIRLAQPAMVEHVDEAAAGPLIVGRRAIAVRPRIGPNWLLPDLGTASLVIDLASPRPAIVLSLADPAGVSWKAFDAGGAGVGDGTIAATGDHALAFTAPASRILVHGIARWFGARLPPALATDVRLWAVSPGVVLADPPAPSPPLVVAARSLQAAVPPERGQPRSELGFEIGWRPPLAVDGTSWPGDADAAAPLDAGRFELEHQLVGDPAWTAVLGPDSQVHGDRRGTPTEAIRPGVDLLVMFPEQPPSPPAVAQVLTLRDHFAREPERPLPAPGTHHRYRIRTIDEVGRPSAWVVSPVARLEKHAPPPAPIDVRARVLVRDAPDLDAGDRALLGTRTSAIVLRWRWGPDQAELDPWQREFRVYLARGGPGPLAARIDTVAPVTGGRFTVGMTLTRAIAANEAAGGYLPAGGEYRILDHGAGLQIQATVETLVPEPDGTFRAPRVGPTVVPVPLRPAQARPQSWDQRVAVTELATDPVVLFDVLLPSAAVPLDAVWIGVSAADRESYVADAFPGGTLPGNESPIAAVRCEARYHGRPDLVAVPPLADVPALATARPVPAGVEHDLVPLDFLAGALAAGEPVIVERVTDGELLSHLRADGDDVVAVPPPGAPRGSPAVAIAIANDDDRAAILAALAGRKLDLADRFVVHLAARHPYADWLFAATSDVPHLLGAPLRLRLGASAARHVIRVRRVDAAGHRSAGAATCAVTVRVPTAEPLAPPGFEGARWVSQTPPRVELRASIPDERATHLLVWLAPTDPRGAELATIGSRRELPGFGVRLRPTDGTTLAPVVIGLDPADVVVDPDTGLRHVAAVGDAGPGPWFVWLAAVDRDGVPSRLSGAFRLPRPQP